jgi:hypothetical protein
MFGPWLSSPAQTALGDRTGSTRDAKMGAPKFAQNLEKLASDSRLIVMQQNLQSAETGLSLLW